MINELKKLLQEKQVSAYEITEVRSRSAQLFYVLNKLETNRYTENKDMTVVVYDDHDDKRGSSSFKVMASDDVSSLSQKIDNALMTAKKINNNHFELYHNTDKKLKKIPSLSSGDLGDIATRCMDAIVKADHFDDVWINSVEIFVTSSSTRFINSLGIDESYDKTTLEIELIPTSKNANGEEYELYFDTTLIDDDPEYITKTIEEVLKQAIDRAKAVPYDASKMQPEYAVIDGEMMLAALDGILGELSYLKVLSSGNHYKKGDQVTPYDLDITMKAAIQKAANSRPFDENGVILDEAVIIKNGVVENYWGPINYGQYIGESVPTGRYTAYELNVPVSQRTSELSCPYIELVRFSSPQFDASTGYFGGEVRLALYHDKDGKVIPVTGLSLSGNLYEAIRTCLYSSKDQTHEKYRGPQAIYLKDFKLH